jgi:hypothetical protein
MKTLWAFSVSMIGGRFFGRFGVEIDKSAALGLAISLFSSIDKSDI